MLLSFLGYTAFLSDNLFPGGDNARYLILTKALLTGNGYRNIGILTTPYHTLAPPGFSLLLAAIVSVFGMNIAVVKMCIAILAVLSISIVYSLFKRKYGTKYALGIAALYSITPVVFMYARRIYSDLPFVFISLAAFMSVERYAAKKSQINTVLVTSILLLAVAFYLRPVALALVVTAGLWLLSKKKPVKASLLCIPAVLLIAPWYIWVNSVSTAMAPSHLSTFFSQNNLLELARMALSNGLRYAQLFTENTWYLTTKGLEHLNLSEMLTYIAFGSVALVSALILTGYVNCAHKKWGLAELYVVIYIMMLLSYGFVLDRFIIPLAPFIIHYYIQGLTVLTTWIGQQSRVFMAGWLKRLLFLIVIFSSSTHIFARIYQEQNFARFSPAAAGHYDVARWAGNHLESTAVVATDHPDFFYVYADHQTLDLRKDAVSFIDGETIRFVVTNETQIITIRQWVQQRQGNSVLTPLYCASESGICLYKIVWATEKDNSQ